MSMRTSRFPRLRSVITFTGLAVAVSACGSSAGGNAASSSSVPIAADSSKAPGAGGYRGYGGGAATAQPNTAVATVSVRRAGGLGDILADASGRTLYLFEQDRSSTSSCTGQCAQVWPPLTSTGAPTAGTGASAAQLAITRRADGTSQVSYAGHPLYYYVADRQPGQRTGQGLNQFGAKWYVLSAQGAKVDKAGS